MLFQIIDGQHVPLRMKPRQRVQRKPADYSSRFQSKHVKGASPCYRCDGSQHTLCRHGECSCSCQATTSFVALT